MKYFKVIVILLVGVLLFADEAPMENVIIEYGLHDILQKESASSNTSKM